MFSIIVKRLKYHFCTNNFNQEQYLEDKARQEHEKYEQELVKTVTLNNTDEEYLKIEDIFVKNSGYKVERIDKNNNNILLTKYSIAKTKFPFSSEKLLYHGTKYAENHRKIFDNGFLIKYSQEGLLGKGIYFADNVSYSNNGYVFQTKIGNDLYKTILLCKVLFIPGKYKKKDYIQVIYDESLCFPLYLIHYK